MSPKSSSGENNYLLSTDTVLCGPDNSNCDHLCLLNNNGTTTCACADGYMLANNGRDCIGVFTLA